MNIIVSSCITSALLQPYSSPPLFSHYSPMKSIHPTLSLHSPVLIHNARQIFLIFYVIG